nr:MAG TPA: hypothetical protein [Caudoviricetes sp.]
MRGFSFARSRSPTDQILARRGSNIGRDPGAW